MNTAPDLCTVSLLLYLMVSKTVSPGSGVWAYQMLFLFNEIKHIKYSLLTIKVTNVLLYTLIKIGDTLHLIHLHHIHATAATDISFHV